MSDELLQKLHKESGTRPLSNDELGQLTSDELKQLAKMIADDLHIDLKKHLGVDLDKVRL